MSLLMFHLNESGAVILTDTLASSIDGEPFLFKSKCWIAPHLGLVIAGTGFSNFIAAWVAEVNEWTLTRDVDNLDAHAPAALRALWATMEKPDAGDGPVKSDTATLYHLGFSEQTGKCTGYAYRSTDDFASEPMEPGFRVKPEPVQTLEPWPPTTVEEMVALATQIRDEQDPRPPGDRVYIGGDLVVTILEAGAIATSRAMRFDDYEDDWHAMNERLTLSAPVAVR